jgi:hypothetical protein
MIKTEAGGERRWVGGTGATSTGKCDKMDIHAYIHFWFFTALQWTCTSAIAGDRETEWEWKRERQREGERERERERERENRERGGLRYWTIRPNHLAAPSRRKREKRRERREKREERESGSSSLPSVWALLSPSPISVSLSFAASPQGTLIVTSTVPEVCSGGGGLELKTP